MMLSGLGDPRQIIDEVHAAGTKFVGVVEGPRAARKVQTAGADAVVAQGSEAGGHVGQTCDAARWVPGWYPALKPDVPVLMAGGIATGEAVAAALALGASGVSAPRPGFWPRTSPMPTRPTSRGVVDAAEHHTIFRHSRLYR